MATLLGKIGEAIIDANSTRPHNCEIMAYLGLSIANLNDVKTCVKNYLNKDFPENLADYKKLAKECHVSMPRMFPQIFPFVYDKAPQIFGGSIALQAGFKRLFEHPTVYATMKNYFTETKNYYLTNIAQINASIIQSINHYYIVEAELSRSLRLFSETIDPYGFFAYAVLLSVLTYKAFDVYSDVQIHKQSLIQKELIPHIGTNINRDKTGENEFDLAIKNHSQNKAIIAQSRIFQNVQNNNPIDVKLEIDGKSPFLNEIVMKELSKPNNILSVYGIGGAGKTIMLSGVTLFFENIQHTLYIPLNLFNDVIVDTERGEKYLEKYLDRVFNNLQWKAHYAARNGKEILFLFDGFNEIANRDKRVQIAKEIHDISDDLNCKIVIASRFEDTLAANLSFGKRAFVKKLEESQIKNYLERCERPISIDGNSMLLNLLTNPLMLTLFGKTASYAENDDYIKEKYLCDWIPIDENNAGDTLVLWNYINCDVIRQRRTAELFKAWLTVNVFWPRLAFYMQQKEHGDAFYFSKQELRNQIESGIAWLKENICSNAELQRIKKEALERFSYNFEQLIRSWDIRLEEVIEEIFDFMFSNQTLLDYYDMDYKEKESKFKFRHQAIRDVLAAIHLLNTAPSKAQKSPEDRKEWSDKSFAENIYMLHHLASLSKLKGEDVLKDALESLRNKDIPKDCLVLDNLLLLYKQPALLDGDFSKFNFSKLDLRNCSLTEFTLGKFIQGKKQGANFLGAQIGENTFIKDTHHSPVTSISVAKDGNRVLSCCKGKVLLWDFNSRVVEREIYRYNRLPGEFVAYSDLCCFSADEKFALFTFGNKLLARNLGDNSLTEYACGANEQIGKTMSLSSVKSYNDNQKDENKEDIYFLTRDNYGDIFCWNKESPEVPDHFITPDENEWICYTLEYNRYLKYNKHTTELDLIDKDRNVIRHICTYNLGEIVAFDTTETSFAIAHRCGTYYACDIVIFDFSNWNTTPIELAGSFYAIDKLSFAASGRWLASFSKSYGTIIFQRDSDNNFNYQQKEIVSGGSVLSDDVLSSFTLFENKIFNGKANGTIYVGIFYREGDTIYHKTTLDDLPPEIRSIAILPNSKNLIGACEDGVLREWNYERGVCVYKYDEKHHKTSVGDVSIANHRNLLVSCDQNGKVVLWDSEHKRYIKTIAKGDELAVSSWNKEAQRVSKALFSRDDNYVICSNAEGTLFVYDIAIEEENMGDKNSESKLIIRFENLQKQPIAWLYYICGDEERIAIATGAQRSGELSFYKINYAEGTLELLRPPIKVHNDQIWSLHISPDGKIYSNGNDGIVAGFDIVKMDIEFKWPSRFSREDYDDIWTISFIEKKENKENENTLFYNTQRNYESRTNIRKVNFKMAKEDNTIEISDDIFHKHHGNSSGFNYVNNIKISDGILFSSDTEGKIICATYTGCEEKGELLRKLTSYDSLTSILNFCENIDQSMFDPPELKEKFFPQTTESLIKGEFEKNLRNGYLINIFPLINPDKFSPLFTRQSNKPFVKNELELLVSSFIACTDKSGKLDSDNEYYLLLAVVGYLYYNAPSHEQNFQMVARILKKHISIQNISEYSSYDSFLDTLFNNAPEKAKRYFEDYRNKFDSLNDETVINALLQRFGHFADVFDDFILFPFFSSELIVSARFAVALVSGFNPDFNLDGSSCETATAQLEFIEMLYYYMGGINNIRKRRQKFMQMLDWGIERSLNLFRKDFSKKEDKYPLDLLTKFENRKVNYSLLATENRKIPNFYEEFLGDSIFLNRSSEIIYPTKKNDIFDW